MRAQIFKRIKQFFYVYDAYRLCEDFFSLPSSRHILNSYLMKRLNIEDFERLYKIYFQDMKIDSKEIDKETKEGFKFVFYEFGKKKSNIKRAKEAYAVGCLATIAHPMASFSFRRFKKMKKDSSLEGFEKVIIEYMANKFVIDNLEKKSVFNEKRHQIISVYNKKIIVHQSVIQKRIDKYVEKVT